MTAIVLTDIGGKMHVFECPPWRVVQVTSRLFGASVHLSSGEGIATVRMSKSPEEIWSHLADCR
jgi:hypothetical protein